MATADKIITASGILMLGLFLVSYVFPSKNTSSEPTLNNEQLSIAYQTAREEYKFYKSRPELDFEYTGFSAKSNWVITMRFTYEKDAIDIPSLIQSRGFKFWYAQNGINTYCKNGIWLSFFPQSVAMNSNKVSGVIGMDKSYECLSFMK